jgi:hypothetical protein
MPRRVKTYKLETILRKLGYKVKDIQRVVYRGVHLQHSMPFANKRFDLPGCEIQIELITR